jgi:photosystem II stability/assembly factor-like uncharacterized protein
MKRFYFFILFLSCIQLTVAQEWKAILRKPGVKYKDVMEKFYEERREEFRKEKSKSASRVDKEEDEEENEEFFRQQWAALMMIGDRLNPDGTIPNATALNFELEMHLRMADLTNMQSAGGQWENLGPNHLNDAGFNVKGIGRVNCAFRNSSYEYACTGGGGLWYRPLGNTNWSCLTNSIPVLCIAGVTTDAGGNTLYILTGDGEGTGIASPGIGILKSTDAGNSWQQTNFKFTPNGFIFGFKLISDPNDLNIQYAATDSGLYKTTDGWNSFSKILRSTVNSSIFDVEFKPGSSSTIYASDQRSIYSSSNSGLNWSEKVIDVNASRIAIAVTPANANYLYVFTGSNANGFLQLLRTTDGNINNVSVRSQQGMNGVTNLLGGSSDGNDMRSQASYDLCIAANPANSEEIWVGGINIWKSSNGGQSWSCEGYWSADNFSIAKIHADHHNLEYFGNTLLVCNDGGFYIRSGNGWTENFEFLDITQFYKLGLDRTANNNRHIAGAQDNSVMIYDGDDNFEQIVGAGDGGECIVDFTDNGQKLFGSNEFIRTAGLANGKIPFTDGSGIPGFDRTLYITSRNFAWMGFRALVMDPNNHNRIMSGYFGLYRSEDHNNTWFSDWNGMSTDNSQGMVRHYAFTWNYNDWVSKDKKVYRRPDLGATWIDVTGGAGFPSLVNKTITGLDVNYFNNNQAWITLSGYDAANKVFSTGTNGASWNNNTYNLPNVVVNCILRDNNTGNVYIGTDIGVYVLPWATNAWIPFRNGMPSVIVTDLEINPTDGKIYASTYGRGLWRSDLFGGCNSLITLNSLYFPFLGEDPVGYRFFQASQNIVSFQQVWHGVGQSVHYRAGTLIQLLPLNNTQGFYVKEGSTFSASIGPCGTPPPILNKISLPIIVQNNDTIKTKKAKMKTVTTPIKKILKVNH